MLIEPGLRARLADLRLATRHPVAGPGVGLHASRSRGAGLEFAQYRCYEPGDELRRVDWKLYARSDRFFVRDAERDSPLTVWILLDTSASMAQADHDAPARTRLAAARVLAACVAELALRQNDRCGLALIGDGRVEVTPAAAGRRQRDRIEAVLQQAGARGSWPEPASLRPLREAIAAGALVLLIGDGFDDGALVLAGQLAAARREVAFLRVLLRDEREFALTGSPRFVDPEAPQHSRRVDAERARAGFLQQFGTARHEQQQRLARAGVRAQDVFVDTAPDVALRRWFGPRATP